MRNVLIILFLVGFTKCFCQDTAFFKTGDERSIYLYYVQKSPDKGTWTSIASIEKGKQSYYYVIPKMETSYIRITAQGPDTIFVTKPILLTVTANRVTITSALKGTTYLTWVTTGEQNMKEYLIEKSLDNKKYSKTTTISALGDRKYSYRYTKTIYPYKYRVTGIFKDGLKTLPTNFK